MAADVRRRIVPLELPVAALVAASAVPLSRLIRGGGIGGLVVGTLVLSIGISWSWRRLRLPPALSIGLSLLLLIWFAAGVFATHTLWGIFPTGASLDVLSSVIREGSNTMMREVAPVVLTDGISLFIVAGVWTTTIFVDVAVVRARSPLLGITLAMPMFVIPGAMLEGQRRVLEMTLFLGAAALVLFFDERQRTVGWGAIMGRSRPGWRWGPGVRLGAVVIAASIVMMPLLPGYGAPPGLRGIGDGDRVSFNPLVAIKPTLNFTPHRTLFTVRSPQPTYYRLTSLDRFTGEVWEERRSLREEPLGSDGVEPVTRTSSSVLRQEIRIDGLAGSWLPASYEPVALHGLDGAVIQEESRALLINRQLERGMRYAVISMPPEVSQRALDGRISYDRDALAPYLELPDEVRRDITPIAERIAGDRPTPFRQARALQNHLRSFTYDEDVAAGHSYSTIVEFLTESQRGYCEQFAGSMAVLARALGIPSRVVIGFAGGDGAGRGSYVVTTEYAHAWVEIFFPQVGWVAFEPTPRAGVARVPSYTLPAQDDPDPSADDPSEPEPTRTPSPTQSPQVRDPRDDPGAPVPAPGGGPPGWSIPLFAVLAVVAAAVAFALARAALVRSRIKNAPSTREAVTERYVDFLSWCAATGYGRMPGETPLEHARRIGRTVPSASESITQLGELATAALWAPPNGLDPGEVERAATDAQAALTATLDRRARALAALGWGRWRASE